MASKLSVLALCVLLLVAVFVPSWAQEEAQNESTEATPATSSGFETMTFQQVMQHTDNKIVVFYKSDEEKSNDVLALLESEVVPVLQAKYPSLTYKKVDGADPLNEEDVSRARFETYPYVFIAIEGVDRVPEPITAANVISMVNDKLEVIQNSQVVDLEQGEETFDALFASSTKPVFVKFFEQWCSHCKAMKKAYIKTADVFAEDAVIAEVECSKNDNTKAFCEKNEVRGYPTLKLFLSPSEKIDYAEHARSAAALDAFLRKNVPSLNSASSEAATGRDEL